METLIHIRKELLGLSQGAFAKLADTSQATVARWESGSSYPDLSQLKRIRQAVVERGIEWKDAWFFDGVSEKESKKEEEQVVPV